MAIVSAFLNELAWRGLLYQHTDAIDAVLANGSVSAYCGFDPTGPSLHVGHLVPVMGLAHLQRAGHNPIALVGGVTGMIGDPSGRSSERTLASIETIEANAARIHTQLERFLDFSGPHAARMRNNADWLLQLGAIELMRDVGKHFTVNYMLAKDSVKSRLEMGISYTEFSYMLLQSYDFLELFRREGAALQIGGSDQWGNITAGIELIRRTTGAEAHAITLPLVSKADGQKFGKTESGAVWLDPTLTSPYAFYQYWINTDDRDVGRYLRFFTLLAREEVEALDRATAAQPEGRAAQLALATDVTTRVHGAEATRLVAEVSRLIFDRQANPYDFPVAAFEALRGEIPFAELPWSNGTAPGDSSGTVASGLDVVDALLRTELVKSKSDARRLMQQGGVSVNGVKLAAGEVIVPRERAVHGAYFLMRKGGRDMALVRCG